MANAPLETGATSAPKQSLLARVIGVITSPGETFKSVVAHPKWLGVLVLTTVVGAVFAALPMTTEGGQQAAIDTNVKAMESFGVKVDDEVYAGMQRGASRMAYTTGGSVLVIAPLFAVVLSGVLFGIFAISGGGATFKQVFTVYVHAAVISTLGQVFTGTLNYFRQSMSSATNLSAMLPMLEEGTFVARLAGFVDLFVIWWLTVLAIGLAVLYRRKTKSVAITLFSIYAVIALAIAGIMSMVGGAMTGKKKLMIGGGIVIALGAIAFANFKFKKDPGITVNTEAIQKRRLEAVVSASGKIQPKRSVNISADTSGRVTELVVNEGDRVTKGQFLLQIDPRNLRTRVQSGDASLSAARSQADQIRLTMESAKIALQQSENDVKRQRDLWKQGLTTREALDRAESDLKTRQADMRTQEQQHQTQRLRIQQESATLDSARYDLNKVRIESPIDGIVTRRNIEAGETAIIGTMNNPGTVLLTIADMSVIEAEVDVDETDIPSVELGQKAKITIDAMPGKTFTARVTEIGNSPIQAAGQPASTQATNFKVVLTLDGEIPAVRPGFTCTADITTAVRENVTSVPIQATTVREMVVDDKGNIVREPQAKPGEARRPAAGAVQAAELKPGQERKELEGVFVVRDGKAEFVPVKTGVAGDKYFEVLSGVKDGDKVIVGPFASVRELKDGALVKDEGTAAARK